MYIFQIFSYLFKKIGDQESVKEFIDTLFKIPKSLRNLLGIVILLGVIYFSYSKIYTNEIQELHTEIKTLHKALNESVVKDDYADDIYYILEVINIEEEIQHHAYNTTQLEIDLMYRFISQNHPNDPILQDLVAMKERNDYTYKFFKEKYHKAVERCNKLSKYKQIEEETENKDTLDFEDK